MTPAAVLSILVKTEGAGAAQAQLRQLDRTARSAGGGLDHAGKQSGVAGRAFSALKGTAGLVAGAAGVGGLVLAGKAMNSEYREAQKVTAQTNAVLKSTGGVANVSRVGVESLAGAISRKAGIDDEAVQSGANLLLTFKNIRNESGKGRDIFNQATQAAVDLSAAGFGSLSSTSKQLGKALNDPVKGMTALGRAGVTFSGDQKKAIEALMATGKASDRVKAQQLILREVMSQVGGSAAAQATASDKFGVALGNLAEAGGKLLIPVLDKAVVVLTAFMNQMLEGRGVGGALVRVFSLIGTAAGTLVSAVSGIVGWFRQHQTVAIALGAALGVVLTAFAGFRILAAVQTAILAVRIAMLSLNAAFLTNPVVLVVAALAALAAGFVIAYRKSETFRRIVDGAFAALKDAAGAVAGFIGSLDELPGKLLDAGKAITGGLVDGIKAVPGVLADAAGWLKDKLIAAIKLALTPYRLVGGWILDRVIGGFKAAPDVISDAAGWLKNRVVEGIKLFTAPYRIVGGWVLNRIVEGFKVVTDLLGGAGGWLKNRVSEFVQREITGFKAAGSWITNRLAEGLTTVTSTLAEVGGWLKNRVVEGLAEVKDGFLGAGKSMIGWIVEGLKAGVGKLKGFLGTIVGLINKLPGVDIKIPGLAAGGRVSSAGVDQALASGGQIRRGLKLTRPTIMMGEEAPRHPEWVIPSNPAYRKRALALYAQLGGELGVRAFADGGVIGKASGVLGDVGKAVGGAAKGVLKLPAGLLAKGADWILDKLPNPAQMLPDWLQGMGKFVIEKVTGWVKDKVTGLFDSAPPGGGGAAPAGRLRDWLTQALRITGKYSAANLAALYRRAMQESGGNSRAINLWDSNAAAGHPSKGLLQTIDSTFNAYKLKGHGDIWNPVDNAIAAIRYMFARYGHVVDANGQGYRMGGIIGGDGVSIAPFVGSYANGGVVPRDGFAYVHQGEKITPQAAGDVNVRVFIGERELTDIVRVEVDESDRRKGAAYRAGVI